MSGRRLILVRHGRTALNREDRLRGLSDPPLDEVGLAQAAALGDALRDRGIALVLTSPLERAVRTGAVLAEGLGVPARIDPRFTDRDYGPWTGELRAEVVARFGSVDAAPGVEPVDRVLSRVLPALDAVLAEEPGTTAVVTHDAVTRPVVAALRPDHVEPTAPNGSWAELRRSDEGWSVVAADRLPG